MLRAGPATVRPKRWPIVSGVAALAIVLGVSAGVIPRLLSPNPPVPPPVTATPSPSAVTASQAPLTPGPSTTGSTTGSPAPLDCTKSNGAVMPQAQTYTIGGYSITYPDHWGFRYGKQQWTWLSDQAGWGTTTKDSWGVMTGRIEPNAGFGSPQFTTTNILTCLTRYGWLNSGFAEPVYGAPLQAAAAGTTVWQLDATSAPIDASSQPYSIRIMVITIPGGSVAVTGFYPTDNAVAKAEVEGALATLKKA